MTPITAFLKYLLDCFIHYLNKLLALLLGLVGYGFVGLMFSFLFTPLILAYLICFGAAFLILMPMIMELYLIFKVVDFIQLDILGILIYILYFPVLFISTSLFQTALIITILTLELLLLPVLLILLLALEVLLIIALVYEGFSIGLNNELKTVALNLSQTCNEWLKVLLMLIPGYKNTKTSELIFEKLKTKPGCFPHTIPDLTSENPEVSKLIKDYKALKDSVSAAIDNKDVNQSAQYNELAYLMEIEELIILVKHYQGPDKKWHVVPSTTKIGDKAVTQKWCDSEQSKNTHPLNRDDLINPRTYNDFKTRYVWFKCDNINQIQELAEIAEAIDSKLVKCPPKEEKKSYLSLVFSMFSTPKKGDTDLSASLNFLV